MKQIVIVSLILAGLFSSGQAQPGALDPGFMVTGKVISSRIERASAMVLQQDGRIVVGGRAYVQKDLPPFPNSDFALARFNTKGDPDQHFGEWGFVFTDFNLRSDAIQALALQPDGKIVAAGYAQHAGVRTFAVARYLPSGAPDPGFGLHGRIAIPFYPEETSETENVVNQEESEAYGLALLPDGKLLLAGITRPGNMNDFDLGLMRLLPNGNLDPAFGANGMVTADLQSGYDDYIYAMALQADGRILVAGTIDEPKMADMVLVRFLPSGIMDNSFGEAGKTRIDFNGSSDRALAMALQPDGKIVLAGTTDNMKGENHDLALARILPNGTPDQKFGNGGKVQTELGGDESCHTLLIQADGRILVAGSTSAGEDIDFALVRYESNGAIDATYTSRGLEDIDPIIGVRTDFLGDDHAFCAALQADGKAVVAGETALPTGGAYLAMARYLPGKSLSIPEPAGLVDLSLYPNPATGSAMLEYTLTQAQQMSIAVYDLSGVPVLSVMTCTEQSGGTYRVPLNLPENLPAGIYLLTLDTGSGIRTIRMAVE